MRNDIKKEMDDYDESIDFYFKEFTFNKNDNKFVLGCSWHII